MHLEPRDGADFVRGQRVTITATARFDLNQEQDRVVLVVQDQTGRLLIEPQPAETVTGPSGEVTLTGTFTVPGAVTSIDVLLPLGSPGAAATTTVASARNAVKPR